MVIIVIGVDRQSDRPGISQSTETIVLLQLDSGGSKYHWSRNYELGEIASHVIFVYALMLGRR